jgi:hypothetical protein
MQDILEVPCPVYHEEKKGKKKETNKSRDPEEIAPWENGVQRSDKMVTPQLGLRPP